MNAFQAIVPLIKELKEKIATYPMFNGYIRDKHSLRIINDSLVFSQLLFSENDISFMKHAGITPQDHRENVWLSEKIETQIKKALSSPTAQDIWSELSSKDKQMLGTFSMNMFCEFLYAFPQEEVAQGILGKFQYKYEIIEDVADFYKNQFMPQKEKEMFENALVETVSTHNSTKILKI